MNTDDIEMMIDSEQQQIGLNQNENAPLRRNRNNAPFQSTAGGCHGNNQHHRLTNNNVVQIIEAQQPNHNNLHVHPSL